MVDPRDQKKEHFNRKAVIYDAVRPGYPQELIAAVTELAKVSPCTRVLEVGCGSGQATTAFAASGCRLTAIDPGSELLSLAKGKLKSFPNVELRESTFEDYSVPADLFDLIYSATAFHWIDAEFGIQKAAKLLKSGGALALFWNSEPLEKQDPDFSGLIDRLCERLDTVSHGIEAHRPLRSCFSVYEEALLSSSFFEGVTTSRLEWTRNYNAEDCAKLFLSYSRYAHWDDSTCRRFADEITEWVAHRGGTLTRSIETLLFFAKRV